MADPILYCHCAYARVVPEKTKEAVLDGLERSGREFHAVADLCEMAARGDPRLETLAGEGNLTIAACYPRAVKWLFRSAGAAIDESRVANMRTASAESVLEDLIENGSAAPRPEGEDG